MKTILLALSLVLTSIAASATQTDYNLGIPNINSDTKPQVVVQPTKTILSGKSFIVFVQGPKLGTQKAPKHPEIGYEQVLGKFAINCDSGRILPMAFGYLDKGELALEVDIGYRKGDENNTRKWSLPTTDYQYSLVDSVCESQSESDYGSSTNLGQ